MNGINLEALHYYLSYKHVPSPLSIFMGKQNKPLLDLSWLRFSPVSTLSDEETVDKMDEILRQDIKRMLMGNVGFLLSGGIDSGIVAAIGATLSKKPIKTFTLLYNDKDETTGKRTDKEYARLLSAIYKTEHHEETISFNDFPTELPNIIKCIGEPFSGYVSEYFISRFAKQYVNTVITGDWADELFGSYKIHRLAYENPSIDPWQLMYSCVVFNDTEKQKLYSKQTREKTALYNTLEHLKKYFDNSTASDSLNRMLEADFHSIFTDHVLMSATKLSKVHSLDIIAPYSTRKFVDLATKIPGQLKMKDGETKHTLKQLALRYLPKEIVYRQKEGFVTPTLPLVRSLQGYIRGILSPSNLNVHGLFDVDYVQSLLDGFYNKETEEQAYKIWNLVCFQVWHEIFIGGNH